MDAPNPRAPWAYPLRTAFGTGTREDRVLEVGRDVERAPAPARCAARVADALSLRHNPSERPSTPHPSRKEAAKNDHVAPRTTRSALMITIYK
eukprot:4275513-Prymnesium_polylepis.2